MSRLYLSNARIVLADQLLESASLLIEDGLIAAINPDQVADVEEIDLQGQLLMPGMIDLHCDALEKEVEPRPGVHFPLDFAIAQADKRNACAGVTTVFHSLSFANEEIGVRNNEMAAEIARQVHQFQPHALIDNRVHGRYEITDPTALPVLQQLLLDDDLHLISFMDHTPGQGQFRDIAAYKAYYGKAYKRSDEELDRIIEQKQQAASTAMERIAALLEIAREKGIKTASHDDDNCQRVDTMSELGVMISEFPINLETAQHAREKGQYTVFGAPNILRGKSQSGNMKALDAIEAGVASCLCADYLPASLIVSVLKLPQLTDISLPEAVRLVTLNPARAAGLGDRGEIAVGKRADLICVKQLEALPQVTQVFSGGKRALVAEYDHG